jgi:HlyD family secretion protein
MKKFVTFLLPVIGLVFAIYFVVTSARKPLAAPPLSEPAQSSFDKRIAGSGLVEAAARNVNVAPPIPGQVVQIFVKENDIVSRGSKLYQIDDREQRAKLASADANIARADAAVGTARADIQNLQEAIKSAQANTQSARANVETQQALVMDAEQILDRNEKLLKNGDVADRTVVSSRAARDAARSRLEQAKAQVSQSQSQISQAEAQFKSAQARLREAEANLGVLRAQRNELAVTLDRLTVVAPQDGKVLQINIRVGEFVASTPAQPPILLGETDYLQVRVDVDEINASRVKPNSPAVASLKGDSTKKIDLEFVRIDPYILPKRSLTGDNTERVDVRVLQVIYRFKPPQFSVYVGQQMDVFIDAR